MTTVAVLQPGYLPWLGFLDQIRRSDVFVYYDDVQFDKHGWRNRNRIKSSTGAIWLTVPVLNGGRHGQKINEVEIDNRQPWVRKHLQAISQHYSKAPYVRDYLPELESVLLKKWDFLVDLDIAVVRLMCDWLGMRPNVVCASELGIPGNRSERLLEICKHFEATRYLSGNAAQAYLDVNLFAAHGVEVVWQDYQHPVYRQLYGEFTPYLSALDLVMNMGVTSRRILEGVK